MRVAIISGPYIPLPPKKYGGIEQVIVYLIKGLKEAEHEPILLAPGDSTLDCEIVPIIDKSLSFPRTKREVKQHERLVHDYNRRVGRALKKLMPRVDIVHSHGFDMAKYNYFPNVTTLHNMITFDGAENERVDYYLKRKDLSFVSISKNQQAAFPQMNFVGNVYNGEDPEQFPVVTDPDNYVCFLGRFDRDKNPHLAIQLAINLGIKIKLSGKIDHKGEGYFEEEIAKYFSHPLVEYLGELDFDAKVALLSNAKVNLHPTNFREPFGLTVLEAAYCGTPTMAIARGSMPELIEPVRTGLLVEDFVEGRFHIEECYTMDRSYIASRSRQLFNYRSMAEQYVNIYKKVLTTYALQSPHKPNIIQRMWQHLFNHDYAVDGPPSQKR